jgi:hypothetical protein
MIEPVSNQSTRALPGSRVVLWPIVLLALAAFVFTVLLFAADARASGDVPGGATDAPIGAAATSGATSSEQSTPSTGEQSAVPEAASPTPEPAPPAGEPVSTAEQIPPAAEQAPPVSEQSPPASEQPAAPPIEAPPPAAETTPPPAEQVPPVVGETTPVAPPPVEQPPPVVVETPPTVEQQRPVVEAVEESSPVVDKKSTEQTAGNVVAEAGSEAIQGSGEGAQAPVDTSGSTHKDVGGEAAAGEAAPGASAAVTTSTAPAVLSEISMSSVRDQLSLAFPAPTTLVHSAGQASCELAVLGASIAAGDAHGLLDISAVARVSAMPLATVEASPTATSTGGSAGGDGGSAVDHPTSPSPGPGSGGGAGSGSAAGGGSGTASSAPFTLVGALLQAAPRAMRRLLLAQQSWRTSVLVLIPERPD